MTVEILIQLHQLVCDNLFALTVSHTLLNCVFEGTTFGTDISSFTMSRFADRASGEGRTPNTHVMAQWHNKVRKDR